MKCAAVRAGSVCGYWGGKGHGSLPTLEMQATVARGREAGAIGVYSEIYEQLSVLQSGRMIT